MHCSRKTLVLWVALCLSLGAASAARADSDSAQLRFLSHALRDHAPSIAEAKELYNAADKQAALDALVEGWLDEPAHKDRVRRYFNDMFGMEPFLFIADADFDLILHEGGAGTDKPSDLSATGVYHLPSWVKASCGGTPVNATAWWTADTIKICPSAVKATVNPASGVRCIESRSTTGIANSKCGCGPEQILCYPRALKHQVVAGVATEFRERALYAYENGLDWLTLFGGDQFIGDRWLYHHYLIQEKILPSLTDPSAAELAFLRALPTDGTRARVTFPSGGGPERSGVVTAPGFMRRFNNFRSRVRALTNTLLCRDIDAGLDPTAAEHGFVNPTLSEFDLAHGAKDQCAGCHYPMDNLGSTILHWNDTGYFEAWKDNKSQRGYVFGEVTAGPRALMLGFVERASGFTECMAMRAWEDFTGASWDTLASGPQQELVALAADGPQALLDGLFHSAALRALRAAPEAIASEGAVAAGYDFARDVNPILERSCAGSACHSAGNVRGAASGYVGDAAVAATIDGARLSSGSMPPPDSGRVLTEDERTMILQWLAQ